MSESDREILLLEYQEVSSSMRTFMGYRLTILGFSITIIGVLFNHLISSNLYQKFALEACLFFIVFALIKTMKSITRHLIIFAWQLTKLETTFNHNGYWTKWMKYLPSHPQDSKSRVISMLLRILNLIVVIYIFAMNSWHFYESQDEVEELIILVTTIVILFGFIFNFIELNTSLNPKDYLKEMKIAWDALDHKKKATH
ncbi:hypothetical protein A9Q87_07350 [Flavobacteriales bacterium 34_180_T64]|nr:hypothetical protein A9Q87_07350 [Flavobacteriales bacterium 34_180_T64]